MPVLLGLTKEITMEEVLFTPAKLRAFKDAYAKCTGDTFTFEDNLFLKDYAGYLIEYLDTRFA